MATAAAAETEADTEAEAETEEGEEEEVADPEELERERAREQPIDPVLRISWADLDADSRELADELRVMCAEYGYPLDPEQLPQSRASRQFGA